MPPKADKTGKQKQMINYMSNNITEGEEDQQAPRWAQKMEANLLASMTTMTNRIVTAEEAITKVNERTADLEYHSRKYNLLVFGLDITGDCEGKVMSFFRSTLEIIEPLLIAACHPIPGRDGQRNNACIVRFVKLKEKDLVLRACTKLKDKNMKISIMSDLPQEARVKRAELRKNAWNLRKNGLVVRVKERGMNVFIEEKINGKWTKRD